MTRSMTICAAIFMASMFFLPHYSSYSQEKLEVEGAIIIKNSEGLLEEEVQGTRKGRIEAWSEQGKSERGKGIA